MPEKILHFTCSKCGFYQKLEPPTAVEVLKRNPKAVEEFVLKELERRMR